MANQGYARRVQPDGDLRNQMQTVDVTTLRDWLAEGEAVTVLDVRSAEDRAQWFIPGSQHVDAYEALKEGRLDALDGILAFPGRPIVTVCNRGKVSQIAAELLRAKGVQALSLDGGMQAWSLAWNTAELPLSTRRSRPPGEAHGQRLSVVPAGFRRFSRGDRRLA